MLELTHGSVHRGARLLLGSSVLGFSLCAALLTACGARSAVDLFEGSPAGGAGPKAIPPLPAAGAGASAQAGSPAQGGAPMMPACEAVSVAIDELRPALTLVVDQSLSMRSHYPDNDSPATRWSLVGDALFEPTNGVVKLFESSVRFGIAFFTSHGGFAGGACPILSEVQAQTR